MKKIFCIVSTKGGSGKSTIASMIMPVLFANTGSKIIVYGLDDNNSINITSNYIDFRDLKMKDSEDVIDDVEIRKMSDEDGISIMDAGGGSDSRNLLGVIKKSAIKGLTYIVPVNDDIEQIHNLKETISAIIDASKDAQIYIILNRVNSLNKSAIEDQFVGVYGSNKYAIDGLSDEILKKIHGIYFLENSPLFGILKNIYSTTLLDAYVEANNLLENVEEKKREWVQKGSEFFKKQNAKVRLSHDVISLTKRIYAMKSMLEEPK